MFLVIIPRVKREIGLGRPRAKT